MHHRQFSTGAGPATCGTRWRSLGNAADETLCRRWQDRHDISAARQLAERHRPLVLELTEICRGSGLPWDDLLGEGQVGLMRAICRFDPDQDIGFVTCAAWCITVTLQEYVQKNARCALGRAPVGNNPRRSDDVEQRPAARLEAKSGVAA